MFCHTKLFLTLIALSQVSSAQSTFERVWPITEWSCIHPNGEEKAEFKTRSRN